MTFVFANLIFLYPWNYLQLGVAKMHDCVRDFRFFICTKGFHNIFLGQFEVV